MIDDSISQECERKKRLKIFRTRKEKGKIVDIKINSQDDEVE